MSIAQLIQAAEWLERRERGLNTLGTISGYPFLSLLKKIVLLRL